MTTRGKTNKVTDGIKLSIGIDREVYNHSLIHHLKKTLPNLKLKVINKEGYLFYQEGDGSLGFTLEIKNANKIKISSISDINNSIEAFKLIHEFIENSKTEIIGFDVDSLEDNTDIK